MLQARKLSTGMVSRVETEPRRSSPAFDEPALPFHFSFYKRAITALCSQGRESQGHLSDDHS